ncbi:MULTISPECIES: hypothetical protein [unclassified Campylobacter]|uniref:hypothetical protein n=1 Tax=unclassified Campylobacter TaxID=2593542 RepID=UPI001D4125DE|nr:hypothetical protein [Campylobacter sp. IFREMER_LSEM_CL2194]EGK7485821.1 hypothetical protein [Campylobacter lari]MCR8683751.1 hypothetical protein [Campylobacter sp. LMG 17559]EGK8077083.1 hypothetical protein [Campylobacter lari]EGK8097807.1 hypothetical protein [Campylobacter lari]MCV3377689.1 hypothetical protein [Campylobacter sp. IFREMER_LSEM_CL2194]
MGFKKNTNANLDSFIEGATGETSAQKTSTQSGRIKRDKKLLVGFTSEEYERLSSMAEQMGMDKGAFIRFKVLNN